MFWLLPEDFPIRSTGSTGDGYRFAEETGHKVKELSPSLVPLKTKEDYIPRLQGLSLKNTELTIKSGKKVLFRDFGEMMFTHFGVTGPMILSASAHIGKQLQKSGELNAYLDLKRLPLPWNSWMPGFCGNLRQDRINSLRM